MNLEFNFLEATFYDLRISKGTQLKAEKDIVLVTLDDATTKALNKFWPLTLVIPARLLESLERLDPKAVGYLIDMNRVNKANPELFRTDWARASSVQPAAWKLAAFQSFSERRSMSPAKSFL